MNAPVPPALAPLCRSLRDWAARAGEGDRGTDPALNDPAPYVRVRIAVNANGAPGETVADIPLSARHAEYLAACLTGPGAFATSSPAALAQWLSGTWYAAPPATICWFVACDPSGQPEGYVPLGEAGAAGFAAQLVFHTTWLTVEQSLRRHHDIPEGSRVQVIGSAPHLVGVRGECGVVLHTRLIGLEPDLAWSYAVRLDRAPDSPQIFIDGELAVGGDGEGGR